jgi:hypothetical protein
MYNIATAIRAIIPNRGPFVIAKRTPRINTILIMILSKSWRIGLGRAGAAKLTIRRPISE